MNSKLLPSRVKSDTPKSTWTAAKKREESFSQWESSFCIKAASDWSAQIKIDSDWPRRSPFVSPRGYRS